MLAVVGACEKGEPVPGAWWARPSVRMPLWMAEIWRSVSGCIWSECCPKNSGANGTRSDRVSVGDHPAKAFCWAPAELNNRAPKMIPATDGRNFIFAAANSKWSSKLLHTCVAQMQLRCALKATTMFNSADQVLTATLCSRQQQSMPGTIDQARPWWHRPFC